MNSPIPDTSALLPCPFCGETLRANTNQADLYVQRYGTHYSHSCTADCHLSDTEVSPSEIQAWNRRAAAPSMLPQSAGTRADFDAWVKANWDDIWHPDDPDLWRAWRDARASLPSAQAMTPEPLECFRFGDKCPTIAACLRESKCRAAAAQAVPTHAPIQCGLSHATDAGGSGKA